MYERRVKYEYAKMTTNQEMRAPLDIPPRSGNPSAPVTLTLALSHRGRGDAASSRPLWIPAFAGMTEIAGMT